MSNMEKIIQDASQLNAFVQSEIENPVHTVTDPEDIAEGQKAREETLGHIQSTMDIVKSALEQLTQPEEAVITHSMAADSFSLMTNDTWSPVDKIKENMGEKGLKTAIPTLVELTQAAEPIIAKFDEVLKQPYLNEHNACVNTVPVLGVKGNKIMYIKKHVTFTGGTTEDWEIFGDFPPGAVVDGQSKPQLFPFNGDLYLAIDRKVWRKEHRRNDDPNIKKALNNFPKLYVDTWQKIGDEVLPETEVLSILPFVQLSANREAIASYLLILDSNSDVRVLEGDVLTSQNTFTILPLGSRPRGVLAAPKWTKLVYFNSQILGYDDQHSLWELTPDFGGRKYNVAEKGVQIEPTTELTATDIGPVVVRSDGYLWKRVITVPRVKGEKITEEWARWIQQKEVTHLAVASPGVMLDLHTLTQSLRDRYVETQEHVLPVINTIRSFATTHNYYLGELTNAATRFQEAQSDETKKELAIEEGKNYVKHATVWAKILTNASKKAKTPIDSMAKQFGDVRDDLVKQLRILEDQLVGLQSALNVQEKQLSRQSACFWGSIAAIVLGLAVCLAGVVFAPAFLIGGGLMVAGVVGAICFGLKMSDLANDMAKTKAKIRSTTTAITQMSSIVTYYSNINTLYEKLLMFFGRMVADAQMLEFMDDATAMALGVGMLNDRSSIGAARLVTTEISDACTSYIDVLSKQKITLPQDDPDDEDDEPVRPPRNSNFMAVTNSIETSSWAAPDTKSDGTYSISSGSLEATVLPELASNLDVASGLIADGNCEAYLDHMESTVMVEQIKINSNEYEILRSGVWGIDPNDAAQCLGTFNGFHDTVAMQYAECSSAEISKGLFALSTLPNGSPMNAALEEAKPQVIELLKNTVDLAAVAERWADQYPTKPTEDEMDGAEDCRQKATTACKKAVSASASAHNSFNSFNDHTRQFQQKLDISKATLRDQKDVEIARAEAAKAEYNAKARPSSMLLIPCVVPPLALITGLGVAAGYGGYSIYAKNKKQEIDNNLANKIREFDESIIKLEQSSQSGFEFHNRSQTWVQLVENVSHNLTSVWSFLSLNKNLLADPDMYRKLISINWAEVRSRAGAVLGLLGHSQSYEWSMVSMSSNTTLSVSISNISVSNTTSRAGKPIVKSLLPGKSLAGKLTSQASKAADTLDQINAMLNSAQAKNITGINDVANGQKYTLFDIASILRTKYVEATSVQYSTISRLYALSYLQGYRAREVAAGRLNLDVFVQSSLLATRSATALANRTAAVFNETAQSFEDVLALIDANLAALDSKVKNLKDKIDETNTKLRDAIIQEIADVVALSFAIGCLGVAFSVWGAAAGPAIAVKAKIAAAVATTGAGLKTVIDSFKLADLAILISGLKDANRETQKALSTLKGIKPFFAAMTESVLSLDNELTKMTVALQIMSEDSYLWANVQLDEDDVESLGQAWTGVHEGCVKWMDVVNAQGISPAE